MLRQEKFSRPFARMTSKRKFSLVALAMCASLMGCATPPEVTREQNAPTISPEIQTEISLHPFQLKDAVRFGVLSSNPVSMSQIAMTQTRNEVTIAKAAFYPELYFDLSAADGHTYLASGGTGLRYTLFDFGERAALLSVAKAGVKRSKYDTMVAIEEAIEKTVKSYIDLAIEKNQIAAAKAYRAGVNDLEGGVRARVEIGVASSVDLNEIESERLKAKSAVLDAQAEELNAKEALMSLTGVRPTSILSVEALQNALRLQNGIPKEVLPGEFPRIAALIEQHTQSVQQTRAVEAGLLPRIAVNMGIGLSLGKDGALHDNGFKVGPNISEAISLGGGRREKISNAKLDVETSKRALDEEIRLLRLRLVQANTRYRASIDHLQKRRKIVQYARKSRNVMVGDYEVGNRSLRDLLDSQRRIHDAMNDLNEARRKALYDGLELLAATNGLSSKLYGAPNDS